ncbi:FAD-binding domain-containing protein [Aspergillus filifer]
MLELFVLSVLIAYAHALSTRSHCDDLAGLLPGKVFLPTTETYASSASSYYALQEQELRPVCIVIPSSAEDVAKAVKRLAELPDPTFAIRSGGHSSVAGAANAQDGVTIDLQQLNIVQPNDDRTVVSIGAGALWQDVYNVLVPLGLATLGGRTGIVGVGGLLTGGGLSTFSPSHGFACDNIVNLQVVLASGAIVNANATHSSDLFVALKGGQNNFGVVTRFDLATFAQGDYWGGTIQYPAAVDAAQLDAFRAFKTSPYDPYVEVEQSFLFNASADPDNAYYSSNNLFYTRPIVDATALRVFTEIQPQGFNSMRVSNLSDFASEFSAFQPVDRYSVYATTTIRLSETILPEVHTLWKAFAQAQANVPDFLASFTFQALPPIIPTSRNSLGFAPDSHPEGSLVLVLASNFWSSSSDSTALRNATRTLIEEIDALARSKGLAERFLYMNYADAWQDVIAGYGEGAVQELKRVAKAYDPREVFQRKVPGGFKLFPTKRPGV